MIAPEVRRVQASAGEINPTAAAEGSGPGLSAIYPAFEYQAPRPPESLEPAAPAASSALSRALGLQDSPVRVFGWIQNSFTGNPSQPANGRNFALQPNYLANQWMGNQYYIAIENPLESNDRVNFGFRFDNLFGNDWYATHLIGLLDDAFNPGDLGYDPVQFYAQAHLPVLTEGGLDVKVGRWYTIVGYESVPATSRPLLSWPYAFTLGQPFTHVGVLTTLKVNDRITLYNGAINGWGRWINQSNHWGYIGGFSTYLGDGTTHLAVTVASKPNQAPVTRDASTPAPSPPNLVSGADADGALITMVLFHQWGDRLTQIVECDLARVVGVPGIGPRGLPGDAEWYGLVNWFYYRLDREYDSDESLTAVWRCEVFRDDDGLRSGYSDTYYETTLGLIYRPRPWLWIRPEARYDWSQFTHPFNDGVSGSRFTMAIDAIVLF